MKGSFIILTIVLLISWTQAQQVPSLYTDVKALQVGDVLTVLIMENAQASRESKSKDIGNSEASINAESKGNLANFLPVFGGKGSVNSAYKGEDATQQNERLTGKITVRIVEQTQNGLFKIKGERELEVNGKKNVMKLEGFVRPRDISTANTVYSYQVADAQIIYRKSGISNALLPQGTTARFFTWVITGLMVAAGAGYFAFNH